LNDEMKRLIDLQKKIEKKEKDKEELTKNELTKFPHRLNCKEFDMSKFDKISNKRMIDNKKNAEMEDMQEEKEKLQTMGSSISLTAKENKQMDEKDKQNVETQSSKSDMATKVNNNLSQSEVKIKNQIMQKSTKEQYETPIKPKYKTKKQTVEKIMNSLGTNQMLLAEMYDTVSKIDDKEKPTITGKSLNILVQALRNTYTEVEKIFPECASNVKHIANIPKKVESSSMRKEYQGIISNLETQYEDFKILFVERFAYAITSNLDLATKLYHVFQNDELLKNPEYRYELLMVQKGVDIYVDDQLESFNSMAQDNKDKNLLSGKNKKVYVDILKKMYEKNSKTMFDALESFPANYDQQKIKKRCKLFLDMPITFTDPKYQYEGLLMFAGFVIYGAGESLQEMKIYLEHMEIDEQLII